MGKVKALYMDAQENPFITAHGRAQTHLPAGGLPRHHGPGGFAEYLRQKFRSNIQLQHPARLGCSALAQDDSSFALRRREHKVTMLHLTR